MQLLLQKMNVLYMRITIIIIIICILLLRMGLAFHSISSCYEAFTCLKSGVCLLEYTNEMPLHVVIPMVI